MILLERISRSLQSHAAQPAFYCNETYTSYQEFSQMISNIRAVLQQPQYQTQTLFGIVLRDGPQVYAAIIALWLEGKAYVPLQPDLPADRNQSIIDQAFLKTAIDPVSEKLFPLLEKINPLELPDVSINLEPKPCPDESLAYLLFTSGTTGLPKGVPITRANLSGFVESCDALGWAMTPSDRCLQMFDLTFDLSVWSYVYPLLYGACVYPVPKDKIKYSYIFELLDDHELTHALMVPSILNYLRPYFDEIDVPSMKHSLFCGEALPLDIAREWSKCLPNATITNVYGPTEDTIFCTHYKLQNSDNKEHNGVLSIGKPMPGNLTLIVNDDDKIAAAGETGELCLGDVQLTPGYWHNPEKNQQAFFELEHEGEKLRLYRTGDVCVADADGDLLYIGRKDFQTKIQGFRVEMSEIEHHVRTFFEKKNAVAVAFLDFAGNNEIGLALESEPVETDSLNDYLKSKLPSYMLPRSIRFFERFPLNSNGKTDRNAITSVFTEK